MATRFLPFRLFHWLASSSYALAKDFESVENSFVTWNPETGNNTSGYMDTNERAPFAWQPFTLRGVAAFARVSCPKLLLLQFIVALLAAATVVWFLQARWFL